jgi:hypothetical protein
MLIVPLQLMSILQDCRQYLHSGDFFDEVTALVDIVVQHR